MFFSVRVRGLRDRRTVRSVNYDAIVVETLESSKAGLVSHCLRVLARAMY